MASEIMWSYDEKTKVISMPEDDHKTHPKGLGYAMYEGMKKYSNNVAQIDAVTGKEDLYSSFLQRSIRTALEMKNLGIGVGDYVSICARNTLDSSIPYIASSFIGSILASLDPSLSATDMTFLLNDCKPKIIFVEMECEEIIRKIIAEKNLCVKVVVFEKDFKLFLQPKQGEDNFECYVPECNSKTAVILFSSGTTGMPKGICLSHNYIMYHSQGMLTDVFLNFATLYWISLTIALPALVMNGKTRLVCKDYEPEKVWGYIEKYKVTMLQQTPYLSIKLMETLPKNFVTSLPTFLIGGNQMTEEFMKELHRAMPNTKIWFTYGQTELIGMCNARTPLIKNKLKSVGIPFIGCSYKIVDPETDECLGLNKPGEIRVKSKWCMNGYLNRDSTDAWDEDGFLKTGDVGYFDDDFCLFIVDRVKEMFKYKGMHYVPAKVEKVLQGHPDISMAVVIGVPHFEDENRALAVVVLKKDSKLTPKEIEEFANTRVDEKWWIRAGVEIIDTMPITPSSKINRRLLKQMFSKNNIY